MSAHMIKQLLICRLTSLISDDGVGIRIDTISRCTARRTGTQFRTSVRLFGTLPARNLRDAPDDVFRGKWAERNWRNVPGPFFGAATDNCWVGRHSAPRHILYGDDIGYESEFLYRQPANATELRDVLTGMRDDPWSGWACDGESHWTSDLVRAWWRDRRRLREWITRRQRDWGSEGLPIDQHVGAGLTDYLRYLDGELADDLRRYIHFLDNGHCLDTDGRLPAL